jgi:Spy/CpxP family protein refolding chaperone
MMSESVTVVSGSGGGGWKRARWVAVGVAAGLLAGGASVWAVGGDDAGGRMFGHRAFMHRFHRGPMDPEAAREHVQMGVKWVMAYVDGTPEQRQRVEAIAQSAVADLLPLRERHHANRTAMHAALSGATVDREALEQARRSELKLADEASARLAQALADAAEVLTPEQRNQLHEAAARFHR